MFITTSKFYASHLLTLIVAFFTIVVFGNISYAQNSTKLNPQIDSKIRIDSIKICGSKITQDFVILRELTFVTGESVDESILEFNRNRVMSLRLFYWVLFEIQKSGEKNILIITVKESWYIFPVPFVNLQNNKFDRSNYGFFVTWRNFRGRDETLSGFVSFGYDPSYGFHYINPVLIPNTDISFSAGVVKQTVNNKSKEAASIAKKDFDYNYFNIFAGLGYRYKLYNEISIQLGYSYIQAPFAEKAITASGKNIDRLPTVTIMIQRDTRDLKQYPESGLFASIFLTHKGFGISDVSYFKTGLDFREYRKISNTNITSKWHLSFKKIFGKTLPLYDNAFLGFTEYVRGHKNDERGGNNLLLGSLEFTYPIVKEMEFSLKLPFLPRRLTSYAISLRLAIFGDTGVTYNNGQAISLNNFDSGYGIGLTILFLPYDALRLEYAFNEYGKGEFLVGTKFSF